MKNNNKKRINILKKDLLDNQNIQNNFNSNNKINKKIGTNSVKLSRKKEIINNIITEDNENVQEILEKLYIEELNKFKIVDLKKEKLRDINLIEKNASDLYNWNTLLNRKISFEKRNEFNQNKNKKKFNSFKKINYDLINYKKGKNVICKLSNELLLNFYKDILQNRKVLKELSPKIKLKFKNNISNLITSERNSFKNKQKIFNILTLSEKENPNFRDHDLKIAAKRKTADVLLKALLVKNKITENSKNNSKISEHSKKNNGIKKKKGLILSVYDENSPDIIKFNEEIHSLSEQNRNKITIFDELEEQENITNFKQRNILSAHNLKSKSFFPNNMIYDKKTLKNYSYGSTDFSMNSFGSNKIKNKINFFKENRKKEKNKISVKLYSNKKNKNAKIPLFRPMSSSNITNFNGQKKLYFLNKSNKRSISYEDYDEIGFLSGFPRKKTSKVGNIIYDKINGILKYRIIKKLKLKSKNYSNNIITKAINSKYNKGKEETKNNKYIQTLISANIIKSFENDMKSSIGKYNDNEKLISKEDMDELNKNTKHFYSCSNNYNVNSHRTKKHKFLNELSENVYFKEMMNEIIVEDKFTQIDSSKRIKSIYNHNK